MRGQDLHQDARFSYLSPEQRVPKDHRLRLIRQWSDEALKRLSQRFDRMYSWTGRPSIPPEKLLRALLLQILYTIRSERLLMEQLDYNLLFRWFVGLNLDDPIWDATVYSKNRERLLAGEVAEAFFRPGAGRGEGTGSVVGRALHGGRDAGGGLGEPEELSEEGRGGRAAAGGSGQSHGGLPPGETDERNAPVND